MKQEKVVVRSEMFCMMEMDLAVSHPLRKYTGERIALFLAQRIPYSILQQQLQLLVDSPETLQPT